MGNQQKILLGATPPPPGGNLLFSIFVKLFLYINDVIQKIQ